MLLPDEEAHHATRVMRLRAGDAIAVFDGRGREWRARIASATRAGVRVTLVDSIDPPREPRVALMLAQAVLKGDHMDAAVRDATMLGVAAIVPVVTERTVVRLDATAGARARERWQRVALASVKQCRRATLPAIASPHSLEQFLGNRAHDRAGMRIVLAEPSAGLSASAALDPEPPGNAILAVGPEGGWSSGELEKFAAAGFTPMTLGTLTLRADAAAVVAISMLRAAWRDV